MFKSRFIYWLILYSICSFPIFLLQRVWWLGATVYTNHFGLFDIATRELRYAAHKVVLFIFSQLLVWYLLQRKLPGKHAVCAFRKCFQFVLYCGIIGWLGVFAIPPFAFFAPILLPLSVILTLYRLISPTLLKPYSLELNQVGQHIFDFLQRLRYPSLWVFVFALLFHSIALFKVALPVLDDSRDYLLTGDQPSYLYMADSLVRNRTINVATNILPVSVYSRQDGKHAGGVTRHNPHLPRGSEEYQARAEAFGDAIYSTHRPGTAILIAPFYAIGHLVGDYHRAWVAIFLIILIAFSAREIAIMLQLLKSNTPLAMLFGMAGIILIPVSVMSVAIYSETIMFFIVARLLRLCLENDLRWFRNLEISIWFSLSPWLQDKYGLWCLPFMFMRLVMLWPNWKAYILPALPFAFSAYCMMRFNLMLYGSILPSTGTLGSFLAPGDALRQGIPGIWFDWGYGLVMLAPITLLLPAGIISIYRALKAYPGRVFRFSILFCICAVVAVTTIITGTWWCWWGGYAPPNRFMLPLVPLVILAASLFTIQTRNRLSIGAWTLSVAMGLEAIMHPGMWYSRMHPARFISHFVWWDILKVRFFPFTTYYQTSNLQSIIIITLGFCAASVCILSLFRKNRVAPRLAKTIRLALLVNMLILAHQSTTKFRNHQIQESDIPFSIGYLRDVKLHWDEQTTTRQLSADLYIHHIPVNFAMAVHYMAKDRKSMLGQDDFDLNLYHRTVVEHDPALLAAWQKQGILKVQHVLADAPPQTAYIRISVYDPGGGDDFRPQRRSSHNILPVPKIARP
jgi:hypothetical protein